MGISVLGPLEVDGQGNGLSPRDRVVSGKSHHRSSGLLLVNKATRPELVVIDGDVLGAGAAAVNDGNQDYVAFSGYVLSVSGRSAVTAWSRHPVHLFARAITQCHDR